MTLEIAQALALIEERVTALDTEIVPLEDMVGRIVCEPVLARFNLPAFDNSAMDGYAVTLEDAGTIIEVIGTVFAGDKPSFSIRQGKVVKIMTGAPIPEGTQAIVPIEKIVKDGDALRLPDQIKAQEHIRFVGEDIAIGDRIIESGQKIAAYQIALLASQGISHVKVYRRPIVAVFASGEELKMHFETVQDHQIYNSNAPTFLARAKDLGAQIRFIGSAKDNLNDIKAHIQASLDADLIVTSGGVSVGDADFTKEAFDAFGIERLFDKINIKPGKPTSLGKIGRTWVLNLPGNPLAALLNFELFGSKVLFNLSGNNASHHGVIQTQCGEDFSLYPGRVTVIPGCWNGVIFIPTKKRSPGMLSPLIASNAIVIFDAKVSSVKKGDVLKILPLHLCINDKEAVDLITTV